MTSLKERVLNVLARKLPIPRLVDHFLARRYLGAAVRPMHPVGHFYSPYPESERAGVRPNEPIPDHWTGGAVALREERQRELLERMIPLYAEFPWRNGEASGARYTPNNGFFNRSDAFVLYALMRIVRPSRVIEIGSGFSSALMLDVNERFLDHATKFVFIDPFPSRLRSLLRPSDSADIRAMPVQEVPTTLFESLSAGDFLFVDSSHVLKAGSDVNDILFRVLPSLPVGCFVHCHDVVWPFDYPRDWFQRGIAWNEAYALRSFLQFNSDFAIAYFTDFARNRYASRIEATIPSLEGGASLWLERIAKRPHPHE